MKTVYTKAGDIYAVSCANGCTITADGTTLCTVEAGEQGTFVAISNSVEVSDDTALVTFVKPSKDGRKILPIIGASGGGGGGGQTYPTEWGSPKVFLSDDCETCTVNYSDTDTVAVKIGYSTFKKVTGSFGGVTDFSFMFYHSSVEDISEIDFSKAVDCRSLLRGCQNLTSVTLNLPSATNCHYLLNGCTSLTSITLDLPSARDCTFMLENCTSLTSITLDLPSATICGGMLENCTSLTSITLDLPSSQSLYDAFYRCISLTTLTINIASLVKVDFSTLDHAYKLKSLQNLTILEGGLAACTTFKMYANNTAITDESIQSVIDALTDYSGTSTSATCQFPAGRLTEEQKAILTAKGWTYTEV